MAATLLGRVRNGAVILEGDESLPEGCRVRVVPMEDETTAEPIAPDRQRSNPLASLVGMIPHGPVDASIQHDVRPGETA